MLKAFSKIDVWATIPQMSQILDPLACHRNLYVNPLIHINSGQITWSASCNQDAASPDLNISSALPPPGWPSQDKVASLKRFMKKKKSLSAWDRLNHVVHQNSHQVPTSKWPIHVEASNGLYPSCQPKAAKDSQFDDILPKKQATSSCFIQSKNLVTNGDVASSLDKKFHNLAAKSSISLSSATSIYSVYKGETHGKPHKNPQNHSPPPHDQPGWLTSPESAHPLYGSWSTEEDLSQWVEPRKGRHPSSS